MAERRSQGAGRPAAGIVYFNANNAENNWRNTEPD
jgi:hypothetical protein